ncbi:MAG TPA: DNA-directed RNA polymerase subunit omega [Anaerovoracaceae bacterium]|nr:DNA-directed RNA polymerase subunit omega [Anaerovoracaceae bacterium]
MLYPSINEVRKKADSRYTLVILAAKRARDIIDGKPVLTEADVTKPVSFAANEIAEDLITYTREQTPTGEEQK